MLKFGKIHLPRSVLVGQIMFKFGKIYLPKSVLVGQIMFKFGNRNPCFTCGYTEVEEWTKRKATEKLY